MNDSLELPKETKRKKRKKVRIFLAVAAVGIVCAIVCTSIWMVGKKDSVFPENEMASNFADAISQPGKDIFSHVFEGSSEEETKETDRIIEGEVSSSSLLYGYYLPEHCQDTFLANEDVVLNGFEKKEWSTYLTSDGTALTLSALPCFWNGSQLTLASISEETIEQLLADGSLQGERQTEAYKRMIRSLRGAYDFVTVTYYDVRQNFYAVDCVYQVRGNILTLSMIRYDAQEGEYILYLMEEYQAVRTDNEITIHKERNQMHYVPYNLSYGAEFFCIDAFAQRDNQQYEAISGMSCCTDRAKESGWNLEGRLSFADGSVALSASFDFSQENTVTISWWNRELETNGRVETISEFGSVTFRYQMIQDTGLLLEKDGVEYAYFAK